MPSSPEFRHGCREKGSIKIGHYVNAHYLGATDCYQGIASKIPIKLNGIELKAGDGAAISKESEVRVVAQEPSEVLLFDMA